jgi:hypothetical protein
MCDDGGGGGGGGCTSPDFCSLPDVSICSYQDGGRASPKDDAADSSFLSFVTYTRYLVQADTLYDYSDSGDSGDSSDYGVLKDCRPECGLERAHKGGQAFKVSREIYRFAVTC